jgi:HSP20 family protein
MVRDMERALSPAAEWGQSVMDFAPPCDVDEAGDAYHLTMDIPGVSIDDVSIEVSGHTVKIGGERKHEQERKEKGIYRSERQYGRFYRALTFPDPLNEEKVEANYSQGVLHLTLPKVEAAQRKKITIHEGSPGFMKKLTGKGK